MSDVMRVIFALYLICTAAYASTSRILSQSPRALLMGDAYTSLADDEFTLFYNPAILGRHKGFSFWPINPLISVSNPLSQEFSDVQDTGSGASEMADALLGKNIHLRLGATPGFKMGRFALSAILTNETNFVLHNRVTPMLDLDYRYDKGFVAGFGSPVSRFAQGELNLGASVKYLQRESLYGVYHLTSPSLINALDAGDFSQIMKELGTVEGSGWGVDLGLDYIQRQGPSFFSVGLSALDVYTLLHTNSNPYKREVQSQAMQVNLGSSLGFDFGAGMKVVFSGDIRRLESQMDLMRRFRLGTEVAFTPILSVMGGWNAGLYSYGLKLNTGMLKLYTGFFNEDVGAKMGEERSERFLIYLSLFDFKFDG